MSRHLNDFIISEDVYQEIRPKNAKVARAHGFPKVHESFERVPSFEPIIDIIGFTQYNVGKYIRKLLNPLTQSEVSLKDNFDAAERIKNILKELLRKEEYTLISLDVVSLFTNVPLRNTVSIVLNRVYNQNYLIKESSKEADRRYLSEDRFYS